MTKMAVMPIYPSNIFSRTAGQLSTKLGMKHWGPKNFNVYINHDLVITLTYFTARPTLATHAFELGKLLSFKGNNLQEMCKWTEHL